MTICSLCLPALAVPTPLPILKKPRTNIDTLNPCSTPFLKDIANNPITIDRYGLLHHSSLDSLSLSAGNCPLCRIILQKIQKLIHDFEQLKHNALYRSVYSHHYRHGLPVELALGLAQRVDGADGFTVLANSKDERILYLIDVFGFCVEPEESMYSISNLPDYGTDGQGASSTGRVRGARVDPDAGSKGTLDVAAGWIHDCVSNHDGCRPFQGSLPSRLLDLDAYDDTSKIRLWETKGTTTSDSYVTLSHCWGVDTSRHVRTTHATLSRHLDSIVIQKLPQSFQDAIKVTRHLGIRFLWIDSLCICQDDPDDWAREAAAMQRVYAGAFLTISADGAPGSGHGFLKRHERKHVPITLDFTPHITDSVTATKPKATHVPAYAFEFPPSTTVRRHSLLKLAGQPLSSRAWAMQERLLSHRVLHFTSKQLFFECNCHFISEDGITILGRWNSLNPGEDQTCQGSSGKSWASTGHQMWYSILQEFTGRQVTVNTDWLPALSGLAALTKGKLSMEAAPDRTSNSPQDVEYVAGLWSNDLIYGLGWRAVGRTQKHSAFPDERPLPGEKGYIAPTWSPASFDGPSSHLMRIDRRVDLAVVTGYSVTLKNTQNPLGEVVDGWISLRASLVKLELSELPDRGNFLSSLNLALRLCTPHSDRYGSFVDVDGLGRHTTETRSWLQQNEIFAVFLCASSKKDDRIYRALVVTPVIREKRVRAERKEFRRIGRICFTSNDDVNNKEIIHDLQRVEEIILV